MTDYELKELVEDNNELSKLNVVTNFFIFSTIPILLSHLLGSIVGFKSTIFIVVLLISAIPYIYLLYIFYKYYSYFIGDSDGS